MSTENKDAQWMWNIMNEAKESFEKLPEWLKESLRNASRMYPSLKEEKE